MEREEALIERIERRLARAGDKLSREARRALVRGIGDDAAILRPDGRSDWVVSTDFSLEGVHFLADRHSPGAIGYRALARGASDLAAMGAQPQFFLLSLALPLGRCGRWLDEMLDGMAAAAAELRMRLIGGDTTREPKIIFALTVIGQTRHGEALRRDGARPGDSIFVSGRLGAAALGLVLVLWRLNKKAAYRRLLRAHLYPSIPIQLGQLLAKRRLASAAMDLSDGLSTDLGRLAKASSVGARVHLDRLPAVVVPESLARRGLDSTRLALHGGEDYGLLFTVPAKLAGKIPARVAGTDITCIGEIIRGRGVQVVDGQGRSRALRPRGWDPFRENGG